QVEVLDEKNIRLTFKEKQRAVTIGQFAVLYDENGLCLGGVRILEIFQFT
ncbi:MAG: tRNA 2-thiouridine(34) synthase MnmA, partial [Clostridia bacterium]|nr:tRNA 2-thiouridine(34) synthase MnmA [Clostridia bacterium]